MNATIMLPPAARDFEIYRSSFVDYLSTRRLAEIHRISQTRVRQIVHRVCQWLAVTLPVKTEAEQEQETRLAQHIAADQFQAQAEQLQNFFSATGDPKYLRQQTRVIAAQARLGIVPGTIDALAADIAEAEEAQGPASKVPNQPSSTLDLGPETLDFPPPPIGDCSPFSHASDPGALPPAEAAVPTDASTMTSDNSELAIIHQIAELNDKEQSLLTMHDEGHFRGPAVRKHFERYLAIIREQRAAAELKLAPNIAGAQVQFHTPPQDPHPQPQRHPQPQSQGRES